jgi:F-type H+-transporting ATPase subunit delta
MRSHLACLRLHAMDEYDRQRLIIDAFESSLGIWTCVCFFFDLESRTSHLSSDILGASGLAGRYASALFDLADANKQLDAVTSDLDSLNAMIGASEDLRRLLGSPIVSRNEQGKALSVIVEKAKFIDLTSNFIAVVADNRRLFVLPAMITAFKAILSQHRGEATVEVIAATELSEKQLTALGASLKEAIGSKVTIDASVDPELLGGLVVKVGSRMIDSSLSTKLQQLRLAMIGIG